ncbi:hypothetical protein V8G54_003530 [Vigna mungo]|uniref:Uncharacterized protein n=1 Tax=Vigna mungo TaxID=3915 RepID=A0AAQ3PA72_VIGMU
MRAVMDGVEKGKKKRVVDVRVREEEERETAQKQKLDQEGPTQEEVDHFFAILRRMKLALVHFHRKPNAANHWREALEETHLTLRPPPVENNAADRFDLNAVAPEAADT